MIFEDEPTFGHVLEIIIDNSTNDSIRELANSGKFPTAIARVGGSLRADIGDLPAGWSNTDFALQTTPLICIYDYRRAQMSNSVKLPQSAVQRACTLGELSEWITTSRNNERFCVLTMLIGLLSLAVTFFGKR